MLLLFIYMISDFLKIYKLRDLTQFSHRLKLCEIILFFLPLNVVCFTCERWIWTLCHYILCFDGRFCLWVVNVHGLLLISWDWILYEWVWKQGSLPWIDGHVLQLALSCMGNWIFSSIWSSYFMTLFINF